MKETPILFNGAMVRAILDGSKTKTRRIVKPQPDGLRRGIATLQPCGAEWAEYHHNGDGVVAMHRCPYGQAGDRLWVRETFYQNGAGDFIYRANYDTGSFNYELKGWRPSIFMPRVASRITLEIVSIGVERVQAISEADAWAEGVDSIARTLPYSGDDLGRVAFSGLWESINAKRGYPWESNPFVWVVEFKRLEAPHAP